jgi:hypothetical protein
MIYRKEAPQPTKLLLRIVASAGAGLLGVAACGDSTVAPGIVNLWVSMGVQPEPSDAGQDR